MQKLNGSVTDANGFFSDNDPFALIREFGSPLYVYNERILRERCREMKNLCVSPDFNVHYSIKANNNPNLLKIIKSEGLRADAVSRGEIYILLYSGFAPGDIFYVANNVSKEEIKYALDLGVLCSADSLSMLEAIGAIKPGAEVSVRFDPGVGVGHHNKVVTAGNGTKFGVVKKYAGQVKEILSKYKLRLVGINQHLGSHFTDDSDYLKGVASLLSLAEDFAADLKFIDVGGGFGVPYKKQSGEKRLDLRPLGEKLDGLMNSFSKKTGKDIGLRIEPGRYIAAECGTLLGKVNAVKSDGRSKYAGTDIGMNVLVRPAMYDSHHDIEVYRESGINSERYEEITVVGNICESSDFIAKNRLLPEIFEGDLIGVLDAGAYGFSMSSVFNGRPRPAEVFITEEGEPVLIRKRDEYADFVSKTPLVIK